MNPTLEDLHNKTTYWYTNSILGEIASIDVEDNLHRKANALRVNALSMIQNAGSGHPGTSLSVADIAVSANYHLMNSFEETETLLFSSKGHDAPLMYALLSMNGIIQEAKLRNLRRLDGLPGHPDVAVPGIRFNTGSLGLGISKAKGLTLARRKLEMPDPEIVVILGDGELQEGQIWESLLSGARDRMKRLTVVVDANEIQSDSTVLKTLALGNLRERVTGSGWDYLEVDGHSISELLEAFMNARKSDSPTFIYAKTKKGAGVNFMMEYPDNVKFYPFHSGALSQLDYEEAIQELVWRVQEGKTAICDFKPKKVKPEDVFLVPKVRPDNLVTDWSSILLSMAQKDERIQVLDADLSLDTGTYQVAQARHKQYLQCGIAEQDMFSQASGLAAGGMRPIVHSFASFLMRAVEQCFNNSTELNQITYVGTLAGILPAMPGHSHQAVSDVGVMQSMPGMNVFEPSCKNELLEVAKFISESDEPIYLRLNSFSKLETAANVLYGRMSQRVKGNSGAILASSPALASQAIEASNTLQSDERWSVYTFPWLTEDFGEEDLKILKGYKGNIIVIEDHLPALGISSKLFAEQIPHTRLGPKGIPPCGQAAEVLKHLGLDAKSILELVTNRIG